MTNQKNRRGHLSASAHTRITKSKTLMRKSVSKPSPSLKRKLRVSHELDSDFTSAILPAAGQHLKPAKALSSVKKSTKIQHFAKIAAGKSLAEPHYTSPYVEPVIQPVEEPAEKDKTYLELLLEKGLKDSNSHLHKPLAVHRKKRKLFHALHKV